MVTVKKQTKEKAEKPAKKKWYENERYKDFLPVEKTHFPKKVASANEMLRNIKMMD